MGKKQARKGFQSSSSSAIISYGASYIKFSVPKDVQKSTQRYLRLRIRLSLTVEEDVLLILRTPFVNPESVRHEHLGAGDGGEVAADHELLLQELLAQEVVWVSSVLPDGHDVLPSGDPPGVELLRDLDAVREEHVKSNEERF